MTVQGFTDLGSTSADNLLAGEFPRVSKLVTVTGGKYERGTILSKSESNYTICSADPEAVLAESVDASSEEKQAVVYLTGEFNLAALKAGVDVSTLVEALRAKCIFVKSNQAY